jgi:superfamily II DNA or RNA helicase
MNQPKSRLITNPETSEPLWGVGAGTVETFLKAYYPEADELIRIASAYFTVEGYNLGRSYLPPDSTVKFRILVGRNEGDRPQLAILNEVEKELKSRKGIYAPIVRDLVHRIENKEFIIHSAREMEVRYHCKFYVCDDRVLVHGSGNYTGYGLQSQHEQASATRDPEVIKDLTDWFEEATDTAKDLTLPLLTTLKEWLRLEKPFHAYLKFLAALDIFFDRENVPGLLLPVYYQKSVIARAIDQIRSHRAAVILAATGLGKTIIGAELAFYLKQFELCENLIVIAPSGVHAEWQRHLKPRGFHEEPFSTGLLFKDEARHTYHKVYGLDERLSKATEKTLIIIDEAHALRNQDLADWQKNEKKYKTGKEQQAIRGSVALNRIRPIINDKGATVVLLTATPYGTNPKNIESLLRFLSVRLKPKKEVPSPFTLDELASLPFVTSLGLRQVLTLAKDRGYVDDKRIFVQFDKQRRYMPEKVHLLRIDYELPFYQQLCAAFNDSMFSQEQLNVRDGYIEERDGYGSRVVDIAKRQFITAWLGSPLATDDCLHKNLYTLSHRDKQAQAPELPLFPGYQPYTVEDISAFPSKEEQEKYGYDSTMEVDWKLRNDRLEPLYKNLIKYQKDEKVLKLLALLRKHVTAKKEKVIVFVERHATAIFVAEFLQRNAPDISVGCMVARQGENGYTLKEPGPRKEILDGFSPISRNVKSKDIKEPSDVLICTDANGIGINLQDANVVINYDPADSADILFQRAGRIIRFTVNPNRRIYIYTFKPICGRPASSRACEKIEQVFDSMRKHHNRSHQTFGLSLLPEDEETIDLTNPEQEAGFADSFNMAKDSSLDDPLFMHTAVFDKHRELAKNLKDGLYSSMVYKEEDPRVAVLIEQDKKKHIILYNLRSGKIEFENNSLAILEYIACEPTRQNAPVEFNKVERVTKKAIKAWLKQLPATQAVHEPTILCGFYLTPKSNKPFARELLRKFYPAPKKA